jgi:hypothetical protein
MTMLNDYAHLVEFFECFDYWRTEPHNELVSGWALCLAEPGVQYAVYVPIGAAVTVAVVPGRYGLRWCNPRDGLWTVGLGTLQDENGLLTVEFAHAPDSGGDWAFILDRAVDS